MSQPFYLGDLSSCESLESTIDGITNLAVDGSSDFLVSQEQLPFLAEMFGLADQDRRFWLQLPDQAKPPADFAFHGFSLSTSWAQTLLDDSPETLEGMRLILAADGVTEPLSVVHGLRERGLLEVALGLEAKDPEELLARSLRVQAETHLPLHVRYRGPTPEGGLEKTAMALGYLLEKEWIHSLSLAPTWERPGSGFARSLLNALELKRFGINYVSCPTCGRCRVDLEAITNEVKERTKDIKTPLTVAIMGCEVNGPGEARHADLGIASGTESGLLIEGGEAVAKYKESELVDVLVKRIRNLSEQMEV